MEDNYTNFIDKEMEEQLTEEISGRREPQVWQAFWPPKSQGLGRVSNAVNNLLVTLCK